MDMPHTPAPVRSMLRSFLRLGVAAIALGVVFFYLDKEALRILWAQIDFTWVLGAGVALLLSHLMSVLRLRYYLQTKGLHLLRLDAVRLYFGGMWLNLFLPGGIGGDAAQSYYLHRHCKLHWKQGVRCLLSARASGLLWLLLTAAILAFGVPVVMALPYASLGIVVCMVLTIVAYSVLTRVLLEELVLTQLHAARYSLLVQVCVLVAALLLLRAMGITVENEGLLMLFMLSSVVAILPISIGGLGIRELCFVVAGPWLGIDPTVGVTLCLLFFTLSMLLSLPGVWGWLSLPREEPSEKLST